MKKVVGMLSKNGAAIYRGELARMMHYGYYLTGHHLMMHGPKESNWVVGNTMRSMFQDSKAKTLDLSSFNTKNVKDMGICSIAQMSKTWT